VVVSQLLGERRALAATGMLEHADRRRVLGARAAERVHTNFGFERLREDVARVATEAYLETARLRTSVRRHTRLVDYRLGEAVSARLVVHVEVAPGTGPATVATGDVALDAPGSDLAFTLDAALRQGATGGVLVRPKPADPLGATWLAPGDLLAFEVVDPIDRTSHHAWATRAQDWPVVTPANAFRDPRASRTAQVVHAHRGRANRRSAARLRGCRSSASPGRGRTPSPAPTPSASTPPRAQTR